MDHSGPTWAPSVGVLLFTFAPGFIAGCAPNVQQSLRQAQLAEVMKLTADMGTPDQIRVRFQNAASLLDTLARYLAPGPNLTPEQTFAMLDGQRALVSEAMRLRAVAKTQSDGEFAARIGELCEPQAMVDVLYCQTVLNYAANAALASIPDKTKAAQANQYLITAALLMANIQGRCEQGNAELAGAARQLQAQVENARRVQNTLLGLLAPRLGSPDVTITDNGWIQIGNRGSAGP